MADEGPLKREDLARRHLLYAVAQRGMADEGPLKPSHTAVAPM
jgi:hypothetical protein